MTIATLTSKGQMTLPKEIRDDLGLKAGDKIELVTIGDAAIIVPRNKPVEGVFGLLSAHAVPGTRSEDYDEAVRDAVAEHAGGMPGRANDEDHAA